MDENPYVTAWADYRRISRKRWLLAGLFVPVVLCTGVVSQALFHSLVPLYPVALGWMIAYAASWQGVWDWRCPRCQECFFVAHYQNPFARRCRHCRLPKWAVEVEQQVNRLLVPTGRGSR